MLGSRASGFKNSRPRNRGAEPAVALFGHAPSQVKRALRDEMKAGKVTSACGAVFPGLISRSPKTCHRIRIPGTGPEAET